MRREERTELRMLLRIGVVIDQPGIVSKLARHLRMPAREVVPGLELVRVDIPAIGRFEYGRRISVYDSAHRFSVLRERWSSESDGERDCDQ